MKIMQEITQEHIDQATAFFALMATPILAPRLSTKNGYKPKKGYRTAGQYGVEKRKAWLIAKNKYRLNKNLKRELIK
jgi:hypothetical protein